MINDIFNSDFREFLLALQITDTEYIVVGGYAVIMHGYYRTTQDLDIWVNKTPENFLKLEKAFAIFGMPLFDMSEENFLGNKFDVYSMGRPPLRIDIITDLKGIIFEEVFENAVFRKIENINVRYLNLNDLIKAKKAAARYRDLDDIEKLSQGI